ncbi:uncharacterized protein [Ptychodera flava]|uniref:uncharacterized protein isoform X1 n=1 Tax=Ptychodera flava TaxID=63121 RepID=UPI00396A68E3
MPSHVDCIVKLGGSAITNKNSFESCKKEAIHHAAQIIAQLNGKCVVVHGAGSFGHFQAREYGVSNGFHGSTVHEAARVKMGFCQTRTSVTMLNHIITKEFVDLQIPAVSLPACGSWRTANKEVEITVFTKFTVC